MSKAIVTESKLVAIGDAIRSVAGTSSTMTLDQMASAILSLSSGGGGGGDDVTGYIDGTVTAVDNSSATYVPSYKFYYCSQLSSVNLPNVTSMGIAAFSYCTSLTYVSMPKVSVVQSSCFYGCNLSEAIFPSVSYIGVRGFFQNTSLITASFPLVTTLMASAFAYCYSLTNVSFPKVQYLYSYCFQNCNSISSIYFPSALVVYRLGCSGLTYAKFDMASNFSTGVLYQCSHLSILDLTGVSSVPTLGTNPFYGTALSDSSYLGYYGSIYVPSSLYASFIAATNWAAYSARITSDSVPS